MNTAFEGPISELECLAEIAEQATASIRASRRYKTGWQLPPSIERASAARERKPVVAPKPEKQRPKTADVPREPSTPAEVTDYDSLIALLRNRADELELSLRRSIISPGFPIA